MIKLKKIGKKYEYTTEIGRGSYSRVFKGKIIATREPIAVKLLDLSQHLEEDGKIKAHQRIALTREINILKLLNSQNVIKFIDVLQTRGNHFYIIQQYANEGTLADLIQQQGKIPEQTAVQYLTQIVNGMSQLIGNGFIHRDLKPQNIFIKDGVLKIGDFGQSRKTFENLTSIVGSPFYTAPEVLFKSQYNYKCDIWSLGVICYQMITGYIPWMKSKIRNKRQLYEGIAKFTSQGVPFPSDINISSTFKGFIRNCLQFEQYDRFDWLKVFWHPIFKSKFKMTGLSNQEFLSGFVVTKLRISIHTQNLNLTALFDELSDDINMQDFTIVVQTIEQTLTNEDVSSLFKAISKNKNSITKEQVLQYFRNSGVNIQGISIQKINKKYLSSSDLQLHKTVEKLCKIIENQKIDMFDLFFQKESFSNDSETALNQEKFNIIMRKLDQSLDDNILHKLFIDFDLNQDGKISYSELYDKLCKMTRIINIKNQNMAESLRKVFKMAKKQKKITVSS